MNKAEVEKKFSKQIDQQAADELNNKTTTTGPTFNRTAEDTVKSRDLSNCMILLRYYFNGKNGEIKYNEFTGKVEIDEISDLNWKKSQGEDNFITQMRALAAEKYQVTFSKDLLRDALNAVASNNKYNPLINKLEGDCTEAYAKYKDNPTDLVKHLNWNEDQLNTFIEDVKKYGFTYAISTRSLGLDTKHYSRIISYILKNTFLHGVQIVYKPGSKNDTVLDLVGGQGIGKTTILQKFALGFYTDQISDFSNKDNLSIMQRAFIVNDDEMMATQNSSFAETKKFITSRTLEYRAPYAAVAEEHPKHFIFVRTTNELSYLRDATGERRFLPLLCNKDFQTIHPADDDEFTEDMVNVIWGENLELYKSGKYNFSKPEISENEMSSYREQFKYVDEVIDAIKVAVSTVLGGQFREQLPETPIGETNKIVTWVRAQDIIKSMGNGTNITRNPKLLNKIKLYLENGPFKRGRARIKNQQPRVWIYTGKFDIDTAIPIDLK